jgi:hypothetical protein
MFVESYFRSVCVLLMLVSDLQQKQNVFHTRKLFMIFCCVRYEASLFLQYMGLMIAILPTHPRVSEVTCMPADAKRQQGLTGTHAQTVSEKILSRR